MQPGQENETTATLTGGDGVLVAGLERIFQRPEPGFADLLLAELTRRPRTRLAVLGGPSAAAVAKLVKRAGWNVRVTVAPAGASTTDLHRRLCARNPYDLIIDVSETDAAAQIALLRATFLHLVQDGCYVVRTVLAGRQAHGETRPNVYPDLGADLDAFVGRARATHFDRSDPEYLRDLAVLGSHLRPPAVSGQALAVRNVRRVRPKLRDYETNYVMAKRPKLGRSIMARPGGTFVSRCDYSDNAGPEGDTSPGFKDLYRYSTFAVPTMHLREYDRPTCARGQIVESGGLLLPDTFRHNQGRRLTNIYINDVAPLFGHVRENLGQRVDLEGAYFHFDSEWPGHFGHTLTEQVSRLWALPYVRRLHPDVRVLTTLPRKRAEQELESWELELLACVGIEESDVTIFDRPVRPDRLLAATPMFSCPEYVHPGISALWALIGERLEQRSTRPNLPLRLFCSRRSSLKRSCNNASDVEQLFVDHGFTVVYPEDLSLADQVAMFRRAEIIGGFAGSALFNVAFCSRPTRVIMISPESYTARNEYMFAAVNAHILTTVWSRPDVSHPPGRWTTEAFGSSYTFDFDREGRYLRRLLEALDGDVPEESGLAR